MPNPTIEVSAVFEADGSISIGHGTIKGLASMKPGTYGLYDPATQRVVDREKVEALHENLEMEKRIEGYGNDSKIPSRMVMKHLNAAGLGREK